MDFGVWNESLDGRQTQYDCLIFDMDDTLYPLSSGISDACTKNIIEYMVEHLGIDAKTAPALSQELYKTNGTTMAGLVATGYKLNFDEFHRLVHGRLPYQVLKPDPVLRNMLLSVPQRKLVFTNGDKIHASNVLRRMGLEDCFETVICFETFNPTDNFSGDMRVLCKPSMEIFYRAFQIAGIDPSKTLFMDDSTRNIKSAKASGLQTVLVGSPIKTEGADHAIESIHNLKEAVPEIWQEQDVMFSSGTVPMEPIVVAA